MIKKCGLYILSIVLLSACIIFGLAAIWLLPENRVPKKIIYTSGANAVDLNDVEVSVAEGDILHMSSLSITEENASELDEYSHIQDLQISDLEGDFDLSLKNKKIFHLTIDVEGEVDLADIDCSYLNGLYLTGCTVKNFDKIKNSSRLNAISLSNCKIDDYSVIGTLPSLTVVSIRNCDITDIGFLRRNRKLEEVNIDNTKISDISALESCKNLQFLRVENSELSGVPDFSGCKSLSGIWLQENHIENVIFPLGEGIDVHCDLSYNNITKPHHTFFDKCSDSDKNGEISLQLYGNLNLDCESLKSYEENVFLRDECTYEYTIEEYEEYLKAVKAVAEDTQKRAEDEVSKAIYSFWRVVNAAEYDYNTYQKALTDVGERGHISHTGYGALVCGKAVCDGFSRAYKDVMDLLGIDCLVYYGDANSLEDDMTHAWNMVKLNGKYYHCDATFARSNLQWEEQTAEYLITNEFGKSDEEMQYDHFLTDEDAPKANDSMYKYDLDEKLRKCIDYDASEE